MSGRVVPKADGQGFETASAVVLIDPSTGQPVAPGGSSGAAADAVATTDTGAFSVIALIKRGLQNWTTLLARVPTPVTGRVPVTSQDTNGEGVVRYITDTAAVTSLSARQVVCLTDTTFAVFTRTGATGSITGLALPAGTLLTGPVTAITLTSGAVAAYA